MRTPTPGPWRLFEHAGGFEIRALDGRLIGTVPFGSDPEQARADAELLCAVPALLQLSQRKERER